MRYLKIFVISLIFSWFSCEEGLTQDSYSFEILGKLKTYSASEIESSRWSIGGETLDRDYADYHAYKEYLGPSGAKRIRLQGGWAKSEQVKGVYDFEWLDKIIDDALSQDVQPWLQVSYGNPIYPGGGEAALAGGIPTSEEALEAWDQWVEAMVNRYKDKVKEWEIWNEPDISKKMTAEEFAAFHVRTGDIIKSIQPDAKIIALGLAGLSRTEYVKSILDILKSKNKLDQFDVLSFHGYNSVPERSYSAVAKLRKLVNSFNPEIELWQGENGAPSTPKGQSVGAMTKYDWSETSQAKWVLRRMLGDMGHGVDVTSIFQISDMQYAKGDHFAGLNSKGLLKARSDGSIERPKIAYRAFQNMATVFSGEISKIENADIQNDNEDLMVFAFHKKDKKGGAITLWKAEAKPTDSMETEMVNFHVTHVKFKKPVFLNPLDGTVYNLNEENYAKKGNRIFFKNIPVGDWPVVIVDKNWIDLNN
ncbi:GH39 family glycosyl hydrolase [Cyclobacterium marinum]|uniref:GH39 family glycosyl hydrolase n=1 Tax=Cyclobacterium marinum TaxID=104 RepID=UPI0030DB8985